MTNVTNEEYPEPDDPSVKIIAVESVSSFKSCINPFGAYCSNGWFGIRLQLAPLLPLELRSSSVRAFAS